MINYASYIGSAKKRKLNKINFKLKLAKVTHTAQNSKLKFQIKYPKPKPIYLFLFIEHQFF